MATPMRHMRIPDELWESAHKAAKARGESVSEVVRGLLADYIAENLPGYTSGFVEGFHVGTERVRTEDVDSPHK